MRFQKIFCLIFVAAIAALFTLIGITNLTDYSTNQSFVHTVLGMQKIPSSSLLHTRAITSATFQDMVYNAIIGIELLTASFCWIGTLRLAIANCAKFALIGLSIGFFFYLIGVILIVCEWFSMWQYEKASQNTAFLFALLLLGGITYIDKHFGKSQE